MFLLLSRFTKRLLEKIDDFLPSPISFCTTSIFFLSWVFFNARTFFSSASRFSRINLCSKIFSSVSATMSSASFDVASGRRVPRGRVADFVDSIDGNWTVELPPPLATLLSEVLCSTKGSIFIWFVVPILLRCLGLLDAVSDGLISFFNVPTVPNWSYNKLRCKIRAVYIISQLPVPSSSLGSMSSCRTASCWDLFSKSLWYLIGFAKASAKSDNPWKIKKPWRSIQLYI